MILNHNGKITWPGAVNVRASTVEEKRESYSVKKRTTFIYFTACSYEVDHLQIILERHK